MSLMSKLKPTTGPIFPWSQAKLGELNPFPRYGHTSNEWANNNQIFFFGGIVEEKAQNNVFMLETSKLIIDIANIIFNFYSHFIIFNDLFT